jgi:hypothetical protein
MKVLSLVNQVCLTFALTIVDDVYQILSAFCHERQARIV